MAFSLPSPSSLLKFPISISKRWRHARFGKLLQYTRFLHWKLGVPLLSVKKAYKSTFAPLVIISLPSFLIQKYVLTRVRRDRVTGKFKSVPLLIIKPNAVETDRVDCYLREANYVPGSFQDLPWSGTCSPLRMRVLTVNRR